MPKTRPDSSVLEPVIVPGSEGFNPPETLRESLSSSVEATGVDSRLAEEAFVASQNAVGPSLFSNESLAEREAVALCDTGMAPTQPITVIIPASSEYVLVVRLAVTGVASRMAFAYDQVEDIKLAIAEACNNAILHATPVRTATQDALPLVTVQMMPYSDRLEVRVFDEGRVPPPGLPLPRSRSSASQSTLGEGSDELAESGLGLLLIQTLMDEVSHHTSASDRTEVRMTKRLTR
ncbi:MAG: serine/threonine-protein kinase RsbW [Abditibacteriota bacterium]|nr:serine/threonine-protein kinase RsbW [Abditibacteriota bacterium]